MRTIFYTNITHEFRTPLTVILGLSKQLQHQGDMSRNETNYYLKAIDRQGKYLLRLVNQLLKLAKLNSGMEKPKWRRGNIVFYIQMVIDSFKPYAESKNIALNYKFTSSTIDMDFVPNYIDDILHNLLSNAIKFSIDNSKIIVTISSSKKELTITVEDNGRGIPNNDIEHIFDYFYQGSNSDKINGNGIGLRYTQQLVEAMNGKIFAKSTPGVVTVFTVVLPLRQQMQCEIETLETISEHKIVSPSLYESSNNDINNKNATDVNPKKSQQQNNHLSTVLIIDDNDDVIIYLNALLAKTYKVICAYNGYTGMKLALEAIPDIVISDIMMPHKDGFNLCSEIRSSQQLSHIPIILLTAKSSAEDQMKGLKDGADVYLCKPFDPTELLIQIERLIINRRLLKEKFAGYVIKDSKSSARDFDIDFIQKVADIIYSEINNQHFSSKTIAEKLYMSISQLNRKMTATSGYTPANYIVKLRIELAKKKLISENKSISQIASECGFYDTAHFSRTFKQHTRVTPTQFKKLPNQ